MLKAGKIVKTAKLASPFVKGLRSFGKELGKNQNWIWAILGMIGLAGTTWQMVDATIKAVKLCEEKQVKGAKEIIRTVWKLYIPGAGFIILTTISIAGHTRLNRILSRNLVTATGLYAASQTDFKMFKDKAKELVGENKVKKIENEVATEKAKLNPPPDEKYITKTGHGDQLFQLGLTGGYFRACPEWIDLQFSKLNEEMNGDIDNVVYAARLLDLLEQPEADIGNLYWDKVEMLKQGYSEIKADITTCHWETINGKQEIVSVVGTVPWPTSLR